MSRASEYLSSHPEALDEMVLERMAQGMFGTYELADVLGVSMCVVWASFVRLGYENGPCPYQN